MAAYIPVMMTLLMITTFGFQALADDGIGTINDPPYVRMYIYILFNSKLYT